MDKIFWLKKYGRIYVLYEERLWQRTDRDAGTVFLFSIIGLRSKGV